jgi:uncharacterized membrane protein YbaN (DUF454 family)
MRAASNGRLMGEFTARAIAVLLIVICFAVGAVGLILPIIPGLLFLAIALMLIAKSFPAIDRRLRRNRTLGRYLESADGFGGLSWPNRLKYGGLLCLKLLIDSVALCDYLVSRLLTAAGIAPAAFRSARRRSAT